MDFNTIQSGHSLKNLEGMIEKTYHWKWFNPSNGEIKGSGTFRRKSNQYLFNPPDRGERFNGHDWALIISR